MKKTTKTTKTKALTPATKPAKAVKQSAPAVKKTVPAPVVTSISAAIDVGFGNTLFIRGEGPGLSWEKGVPMECVADEKWTITLGESSAPIAFKFLLNDETWCAGDDYSIASGQSGTFKPEF